MIYWRFLSLFGAFLLSANFAAAQSRQRAFDVQHYTIRTSFDRASKIVFGETVVRLKPLAANFKSLELDAANFEVAAVTLEKNNQPLVFTATDKKIFVTLDKAYDANQEIAVLVKYRTVKPRAGIRFVEAIRKDDREIRPAQIWSQGEPEENKYWFPGYDSPDDKATSEQFITVQPDETAIANGELVAVTTNADKTKTFHYRMNNPHATYLTSLVVGKYARVADKYNDVPLNFYVYPGTESIVPRAYGKTKKMFAFYEDKLKIKFPFAKYDQTVVADFDFGGMENITATTMADTEIYAARDDKYVRGAENLVSHELAHSWFGNLVTCKNWSNLWLNEGFATFFESAFIESEYGREAYLDEMRLNAAQYFSEAAYYKHPLEHPRALPNAVLFDATTYKKGGFVVHMLREIVGDELFWKSLNVYLNQHKFGNVETADLQRAFEKTAGKKLDWFFDQWVRRAGFPRLEIKPEYNQATKRLIVRVRQTQKPDQQTPAAFRLAAELEIVAGDNSKTEKLEITEREQIFTFDQAVLPTNLIFDRREQILDQTEIEDISEIRAKSATK